MGPTWQSMIDDLQSVRTGDFRDDNEYRERLIDELAFTVQTMLEKLRAASDEH